MILLHRAITHDGVVEIALHKADGSVSYRKHGATQTWVDARGRNLADFIDGAVELLLAFSPRRTLVLGYGGGVAATLLDRAGIDVVAVDLDPMAERLARLFFHAPPHLDVVVDDAARYVERARPGAFDSALVDFQDSPTPAAAYLDWCFWRSLGRALRPAGKIVVNLTDELQEPPAFRALQAALVAGGFDVVGLSPPYAYGNRLLVAAVSGRRRRAPERNAGAQRRTNSPGGRRGADLSIVADRFTRPKGLVSPFLTGERTCVSTSVTS